MARAAAILGAVGVRPARRATVTARVDILLPRVAAGVEGQVVMTPRDHPRVVFGTATGAGASYPTTP